MSNNLWAELVDAGVTAQNSEVFAQADRNADDTASEEGFELYSDRWFEIFDATYNMVLDQNGGTP